VVVSSITANTTISATLLTNTLCFKELHLTDKKWKLGGKFLSYNQLKNKLKNKN
jgi:hypothetical protein